MDASLALTCTELSTLTLLKAEQEVFRFRAEFSKHFMKRMLPLIMRKSPTTIKRSNLVWYLMARAKPRSVGFVDINKFIPYTKRYKRYFWLFMWQMKETSAWDDFYANVNLISINICFGIGHVPHKII
jgi:hypothetical protein